MLIEVDGRWVNPQHVACVSARPGGGGTKIDFVSGTYVSVRLDLVTVVDRLNGDD